MISEDVARKQLQALYQEGSALAKTFTDEEEHEIQIFEEPYQRWYTRALPLMKSLAPDRYAEFQRHYSRDERLGVHVHWSRDHAIKDFILGVEDGIEDIHEAAARCFRSQLALLKSVEDRLAWSSIDTADQAERGMQLAFLETARDLMQVNERAAGALAGTVLETYLKKLASTYKLKFRKQAPSIREYLEALKTAKALDIAVHSKAIWLAEISDRSRAAGETPTKLQVRDLIDGTLWFITNIF
jgi:hypothetical protein